jgi:hypothetical protein
MKTHGSYNVSISDVKGFFSRGASMGVFNPGGPEMRCGPTGNFKTAFPRQYFNGILRLSESSRILSSAFHISPRCNAASNIRHDVEARRKIHSDGFGAGTLVEALQPSPGG